MRCDRYPDGCGEWFDGLDATYEWTREDDANRGVLNDGEQINCLLLSPRGQWADLVVALPFRALSGVGMPGEKDRHAETVANRRCLSVAAGRIAADEGK